MKAASCRYFTVYGERGKENHAVTAMIARAFIKQDPFVVWGDGRRCGTGRMSSDIVDGTILAAEKIDDGTAINLGTMERTHVIDAVHEVMRYTGHEARIELQLGHADRPAEPRRRQLARPQAARLGAAGVVRGRAPPDDRLVLRDA